jgi:hypothetical protein
MSPRHFLRTRRGVTAVEFAIIAPVLMLMGLGTLEYGRLAWTQEALQAAATAGARCMGVLASGCAAGGAYSPGNSKSFVISEAANWNLMLTADNVTVARPTTCGGVANFSTVTIAYKFQTVLPLLITALQNGIDLSVSVCYPVTR